MFGGDPFDPFNQMRRQMADMDRMMAEPFGMMDRMMNQMLGGGVGFGHPMLGFGPPPAQQQRQHQPHPMNAMDLFGGFGGFGGGLMRTMDHAMNDPNSMVFSQSTMITMNPDGTQRVVSNSTRKAGDVKETRRAMRDGEREHVAIGHHIGDRTHVIEKKRDKDGRIRQNQKFVNIDEAEAEDFNNEFKNRATRNLGGGFDPFRNGSNSRKAIDSGRTHSRGRQSELTSGVSAPIITIPDDDDEEVEVEKQARNSRSNRYGGRRYREDEPETSYVRSNHSSGPTIREISDEEADAEKSKRRKGMFGKFFSANDD